MAKTKKTTTKESKGKLNMRDEFKKITGFDFGKIQDKIPQLESLLGELQSQVYGRKTIIKTIPMRKEWTVLYEKSNKIINEIKFLMNDLEISNKQMWSKVERDLGMTNNMHINNETNEIEVYAKED